MTIIVAYDITFATKIIVVNNVQVEKDNFFLMKMHYYKM